MLSALVVHPIRLLGALLIGTGVISGLVYSVLSINQISLRQRITPIHLLGRVTAARRFLIFCMAPVGAAAGGWMGAHLGYEATMLAGGCVTLVAALWMWASRIREEPWRRAGAGWAGVAR